MFEFLIVAGLAVAGFALFSFATRWTRRAGAVCILGATFLAGWFLSGGRIWVGAAAAAAWFFIPWIELLTRIRRLRLPIESAVRWRVAPRIDGFDGLETLTSEIEEEGFRHVEDAGWQWGELEQFVRIFYDQKRRAEASLCVSEQGGLSIAYLTVACRTPEGRTLLTTSFPFSPTLKTPPLTSIHRVGEAESFRDVLDEHDAFLDRENISDAGRQEVDPDELRALMANDLRSQIDHNLAAGVVRMSEPGTVRYSWRGLVFLWYQCVKDMVRLT